jgi:hypothetical protein
MFNRIDCRACGKDKYGHVIAVVSLSQPLQQLEAIDILQLYIAKNEIKRLAVS